MWDLQKDHMFFFLLDDWLSVENEKNGTVEKEALASCKVAGCKTYPVVQHCDRDGLKSRF